MELIKKLLGSKKWVTTLGSLVIATASVIWGGGLGDKIALIIAALAGTYNIGQGLSDLGKDAK